MKLIRIASLAVAFIFAGMATNAFAISSSNSSKVRDFHLKPINGKVLQRSDISLAIRRFYKGARPRITKRLSGRANCYDVKFVYKSELKRVSFNCTATKLAMRAKY